MASRLGPALAILAFAAAGCTQEAQVVVSRTGDDVAIDLKGSNGEKVCPMTLNVAVWNQNARDEVVWSIAAADQSICVDRFVYGRTPPGFRQVVTPQTLKPGILYRVAATAPTRQALQLFEAGDGQGSLNRDPPPDRSGATRPAS